MLKTYLDPDLLQEDQHEIPCILIYPQSISREAVEKLREKRRIRKVKKSEQYLMIELFQDFCVLLDNHGTDE